MVEEATAGSMEIPKHGEFCWSEIASTDLKACSNFYSNVFGWIFERSENSGEEFEYLEFSSHGSSQHDGGIYQMKPEMFGGTPPPPHIALYVSVDDVDHSLERVAELGGSVIFGPYDIPHVGRMAVIKDPSGASISLITLKE